jgi:fructokinase
VDIVCLGELLIDMFPAEVGRGLVEVSAFRPKPGGAPANVAVAAARLSAQSAFIGKVGEDLFGHFLVEVLGQEGVETRGIHFDEEARTTMAIIAMPDEHSAEFVFYRNPGADMRLRADELDYTLLSETSAFHFSSLSLTHEPARSATLEAAKIARRTGALVSYDVNYRPSVWRDKDETIEQAMNMLPHVDLVKVNETEMALLSGYENLDWRQPEELSAASRALLEHGPKLCVLTLGPNGSFFQIADDGEDS